MSKRIKTVSKAGNTYYKNTDEVNRKAQRKHYAEHLDEVRVQRILRSVEQGMCPRWRTIEKYQGELDQDTLVTAFQKFAEKCEDLDDRLIRQCRFNKLLARLEKPEVLGETISS